VTFKSLTGGYCILSLQAVKAKTSSQQQVNQGRPMSAVATALQEQQQQQHLLPLPAHLASTPSTEHLHMPSFETVDIAILRECLQWEFQELVGPPGPPGTYGSDESEPATDEDDFDYNDDNDSDDGGGRGSGGAVSSSHVHEAGHGSGGSGQMKVAQHTDVQVQQKETGFTKVSPVSHLETHSAGLSMPTAGQHPAGHQQGPEPQPAKQLPVGGIGAAASQGRFQQANSASNVNGCKARSRLHNSSAEAAVAAPSVRAPRQRGRSGLNFESLLDDLVVLSFLVKSRVVVLPDNHKLNEIARVNNRQDGANVFVSPACLLACRCCTT
jgi:hypothetical protein